MKGKMMIRQINQTSLLVCIVLIVITSPAKALLLHTEAQATMTHGNSSALNYMPIGTTVSSSVDFDILPGTPSSDPSMALVSGSFTWDETHEFIVNRVSLVYQNANGLYAINFSGTGPLIDGLVATHFYIFYDLGVNPFTTTHDLSELLMTSTVEKLYVIVATEENFDIWTPGYLTSDVTGFVIPEPATFSLFAFGAMLTLRRKRL